MDRSDDHEEFLEFLEFIELSENSRRAPKRYLRDAENPLEFFNDEDFRCRYRFSKAIVTDVLLPFVADDLTRINSRGLPIPAVIQLLTCLRYYATGNFQVVSGDLRGVSQQSVSVIIRRVSELIAGKLPEYVHWGRSDAEKQQNTALFAAIAGFPGVAGCIDCTHIKISSPGGDNAEVFRNRKGFFSLNVQIAVGPQMEMLDVVVRHPGSTHDSVIFDRSAVRILCERGEIGGMLLGDNGYSCRRYLLTPVIRPVTENEARYNRAHIRTRNVVERVFGVWKRRFPCLHNGITTKLETAQTIICATATLYNVAVKFKDDFQMPDAANEDLTEHSQSIHQHDELGLVFRRHFITTHF